MRLNTAPCRTLQSVAHRSAFLVSPSPSPRKQVLDEVQMLGDESRGWAFTRALLGLPARTLHVCGDPAVLPLLRRIVAETGGRGAPCF